MTDLDELPTLTWNIITCDIKYKEKLSFTGETFCVEKNELKKTNSWWNYENQDN